MKRLIMLSALTAILGCANHNRQIRNKPFGSTEIYQSFKKSRIYYSIAKLQRNEYLGMNSGLRICNLTFLPLETDTKEIASIEYHGDLCDLPMGSVAYIGVAPDDANKIFYIKYPAHIEADIKMNLEYLVRPVE